MPSIWLGHPGADPPPVQLDLGLARASSADADAARGAPADLAGQVATPAAQPRQQVVELSQLDLGLALAALGVLSEDVEDQSGPVDHLDLDDLLQVPQLAGSQLAVTDEPM
jgi:hypothetical protein